MRLVRLGQEPTEVGADVRAALAAWGHGTAMVGGIALVGVTPIGCRQPLDAVIVLPRGILVVIGVDLPDPALRLDAPLDGVWKVDNWDLVRPDGIRNPAAEALDAAAVVSQNLQAARTEPLPVSTVIAVGPYVGQVIQPTSDLNRGIRVLHPSAGALLSASRELATADRPCSLEQGRQILRVINRKVDPSTQDLAREGFPDVVSSAIASASTVLLPKVVSSGGSFGGTFTPTPVGPTVAVKQPGRGRGGNSRVLAYGGVALIGLVLVVLIAVAARSCGTGSAVADNPGSSTAAPTTSHTTTVDGVAFRQEASEDGTDCAQHSFGDVRVWLTAHPCAQLRRGLFRAEGQDVVASLAVVGFADEATAQDFQKTLLTPGAGSVSDLIRDGKPLPDGPLSFDGGAFTTVRDGRQVRIAQAVFVGKPSTPENENLRAVANRAVQLPAPR